MQKTADFRIISFPAHKSKEDLHFSAYKAFAPTGRLADCYHTQVDALG